MARFLVRAASDFCVPERVPEDLIGRLLGGAPKRLAERYEIQARAAVLPRVLQQLGQWECRARGIGYLDEGYAAAQLFKSDWEAAGASAALTVAERLLRELQPVITTVPEALS